MTNLKKWTGVFLIRAIQDSIAQATQLIEDIRKIDFGEDVAIVLCVNVLKSNFSGLLPEKAGQGPVPAPSPAPVFTTAFYLVKRNETLVAAPVDPSRYTPPPAAPMLNDLIELLVTDKFDIDNPDCIENFLRKGVMDHAPAERYTLITWDHGSGYNIFSTDPADKDKLHARPIVEKLPNDKKPSVVKALTMEQLANAIKGVLSDKKLDVLIMMNCAMQSYDTGYALRNNVQYLVAPQTDMDFSAYNFQYIFRKLASNPDMPTLSLINYIMDSFPMTMYAPQQNGVTARSTIALFAVDLTQYERLAEGIDLVVTAIQEKLFTNYPEIMMAWSISIPVNSSSWSVDFFFLLDNLAKTLGTEWEYDLRRMLNTLRNQMVVGSYVGSTFAAYQENATPSGFSIFFYLRPEGWPKEAGISVLKGILMNLPSTKDREWNNFILRLLHE